VWDQGEAIAWSVVERIKAFARECKQKRLKDEENN
jgi:hypothetical protein